MPRLSAKEINLRKVNTLMKGIKSGKINKIEAVKELNQRFARMKTEDEPWYEEMYPKYIQLMKIS